MSEPVIPSKLYHYCNGEGFLGILQSECIWLQHLKGMNDFMEGKWFLDFFEEFCQQKAHDFAKNMHIFRAALEQCDPFAACFTEDGDSLSQWWAYGDDGHGFAIGFDPSSFGLDVRRPVPVDNADECPSWWKVVYDRENLLRLAEHVVENATLEYPQTFSLTLLSHCLYAKNPKFALEKEWRVVRCHSELGKHATKLPDMKWRQTVYGPTPYFELPFGDTKPVVEVVLGPKNPANERMVKMFLDSQGYNDAVIVRSEASYR